MKKKRASDEKFPQSAPLSPEVGGRAAHPWGWVDLRPWELNTGVRVTCATIMLLAPYARTVMPRRPRAEIFSHGSSAHGGGHTHVSLQMIVSSGPRAEYISNNL